MADIKEAVHNALSALPGKSEIRARIAENLKERQLLRRVLKMVEEREQIKSDVGGRRDGND